MGGRISPVAFWFRRFAVVGLFFWCCAVRAGSPVVAWGPAVVISPAATNVVAVGAGAQSANAYALRSDGTVLNCYNGSVILSNVIAISAGNNNLLALRTDGSVTNWTGVSGVAAIPGAAIAISAGYSHQLILRPDGTVSAFGTDAFGESDVPPQATNVVSVAAGDAYSIAVRSDGSVIGWGNNQNSVTNIPADLTNAVFVAPSLQHATALKSDGTLESWGNSADPYKAVPANVTNVIALASQVQLGYHIALLANGTVQGWGRTTGFTIPANLTNVFAISAGYYALAVTGAAPAIVTQPLAQTNIYNGSQLTLSANVSASPPAALTWSLNGSSGFRRHQLGPSPCQHPGYKWRSDLDPHRVEPLWRHLQLKRRRQCH